MPRPRPCLDSYVSACAERSALRLPDVAAVRDRMQALYKIDRESAMRTSHANPDVRRLYDEFLGQPLGEKSHQLLHTHYHKREVFV